MEKINSEYVNIFVVTRFPSAKLQELLVKVQRVSWKVIHFRHVCRAGCIVSAYWLEVIQGNAAPVT